MAHILALDELAKKQVQYKLRSAYNFLPFVRCKSQDQDNHKPLCFIRMTFNIELFGQSLFIEISYLGFSNQYLMQ